MYIRVASVKASLPDTAPDFPTGPPLGWQRPLAGARTESNPEDDPMDVDDLS